MGRAKAEGCIVFVERSNYKKSSSSTENILADLHATGFAVVYFESHITQIQRWMRLKGVEHLQVEKCHFGTPVARCRATDGFWPIAAHEVPDEMAHGCHLSKPVSRF
jgi:hypothetical protein